MAALALLNMKREATQLVVDHSEDGQSQVSFIVSILTVACALSTLAVVLRLFTRLRILHTFGADDFVMGIAQILTLGSAATIFSETAYGLGRHTWLITNLTAYMKSFYSSVILYNVGTCVLKISILLQLRRIFRNPLMNKLTIIGLVFETLWVVTISVLLPLICNPVEAFWDTSIEGKCLDELQVWYVMAAVNLVTDFVVFSLPLPVIKNLQLPKRQKILLMGVFCLGFFTCIISVYRITTLKAAADSVDPAWDNTDAAVWSLLELSIGVLAACLPTLKPLFAMALPRLFGSSSSAVASSGFTGQHYGKPPHAARPLGSKSSRGGGVYVQDVDGDTAALRTDGSFASGKDRDIEMPSYQVSVSGGSPKQASVMEDKTWPREAGIHTTTIVTQRVDPLRNGF